MKVLLVPTFTVLALLAAAIPVSAHHSWPVKSDRLVTVKGTVDRVRVGQSAPDDHS